MDAKTVRNDLKRTGVNQLTPESTVGQDGKTYPAKCSVTADSPLRATCICEIVDVVEDLADDLGDGDGRPS